MARNIEQDVPFGFVGMAFCDQRLDHRDHLANMLRCPRLDVRWSHAECAHVIVVGRDKARRDLVDTLARFQRCGINLVVHIGEIARKCQLVVFSQQSRQKVEYDRRPGIAYVRVVVNRGSTEIHRHLASF